MCGGDGVGKVAHQMSIEKEAPGRQTEHGGVAVPKREERRSAPEWPPRAAQGDALAPWRRPARSGRGARGTRQKKEAQILQFPLCSICCGCSSSP
eukprot:3593075-Pyramimonas_sp.AAC.1